MFQINYLIAIVTFVHFIYLPSNAQDILQFLEAPYEINLLKPLKKYDVVSDLYIKARHLDLTSKSKLLFRVDSDFFELSPITEMNGVFSAKLIVKKSLPLNKDYTFTVSVFDEKNLSSSAATYVTIKGNKNDELILRNIGFEEPFYRGFFQDKNTLKFDTKIKFNDWQNDSQFILYGEYAKYFTTDSKDNEVTIKLKKDEFLPKELLSQEKYILLYLHAILDNKAVKKTLIILDFLEKPIFSLNECPTTVCPDCTTPACPECPPCTTVSTIQECTCPTCPTITCESCNVLTCPTCGTCTTMGCTCAPCPDCATLEPFSCPPMIECPTCESFPPVTCPPCN